MPNPYSFVALNLLHQASVTLTHAQIRALHTTGATIMAAPGTSRVLCPLAVWLAAHFPVPYTPYSPTNWETLMLRYGDDITVDAAQLYNTDATSGNVKDLNEVLANRVTGSAHPVDHLTHMALPGSYSSDYGMLQAHPLARDVALYTNQPLKLWVSPSAIVGGGAANTLTVAVLCTVYDVETKQFI